eukprot:jgi/Ulvmu1/10204/UM060_0004.1
MLPDVCRGMHATKAPSCHIEDLVLYYHAVTSSCSSMLTSAIICLKRPTTHGAPGNLHRSFLPATSGHQTQHGRPSGGALPAVGDAVLTSACDMLMADAAMIPDAAWSHTLLRHTLIALLTSTADSLGRLLLKTFTACDTVLQNVQELVVRLESASEQTLTERSSGSTPWLMRDQSDLTRSAPVITHAAQQIIWANQQLASQVKSSPQMTAFRMGQLTPEMRSVCYTALEACGVGGPSVGNTVAAEALLLEVLGRMDEAAVQLIHVSCNCRLLLSGVKEMGAAGPSQSQPAPGSETAALHNVQGAMPIAPCLGSVQAAVAEVTMLAMQLDTAALSRPVQYVRHIWMAVAAKLVAFQEAKHMRPIQHVMPLAPACVKMVVRKALHDVKTWANATASECQSWVAGSQNAMVGLHENLVPSLGPVQVLRPKHGVRVTSHPGFFMGSLVQVLMLLLSETFVHERGTNGTHSSLQLDWAAIVRKETANVCNHMKSGRGDTIDSGLLLVLQALDAPLDAAHATVQQALDHSETPSHDRCVMDAWSAYQVICMAQALLLNLTICLVRAGCASRTTIIHGREWAGRVMKAAVDNRVLPTHESAVLEAIQTRPRRYRFSGVFWLTEV